MAYAVTTDTRVHVLGDLYMMTGTFTDGGVEVNYSNHLSTVLAAGGHLTSLVDTGVEINEGAGYAPTATTLTGRTIGARPMFAAGQTIYTSAGARLGIISAVTNDTTIVIAAPGIAVPLLDNDTLFLRGASKPSLTLVSTSIDVSIDEALSLVIFENGNRNATSTLAFGDGRWWILGTR